MPNIVVVEPDSDLRNALSAQVPVSFGDTTVIVSEDGDTALQVLRTNPVDLMVVNVGLRRGLDAVALILSIAARHPTATVLLRGESLDASSVSLGVGCVRHPNNDISSLVEAMTEAIARRGDDGRTLASMPLARLLEVIRVARWSGALSIRTGRRVGVLVSDAGVPVHASFDGTAGEEALRTLLGLPGGTLAECDPPISFKRNLTTDPAALVAEGVRAWLSGAPQAEVEITEDDLIDFMGDVAAPAADAFELFSETELAELMLDDGMAIPLVPPPKEDA